MLKTKGLFASQWRAIGGQPNRLKEELVARLFELLQRRAMGPGQLRIRSSRYRPARPKITSGEKAAMVGGSRLASPIFSKRMPKPR